MSMSSDDYDATLVPARRRRGSAADSDPAMREWAQALVARARADGVELTGDGGLLTGLVRQVLQAGLEVEMEDHLGYAAHDPVGRGSGNSRNGTYPKTVTTEVGQVELAVPRDRARVVRSGHCAEVLASARRAGR